MFVQEGPDIAAARLLLRWAIGIQGVDVVWLVVLRQSDSDFSDKYKRKGRLSVPGGKDCGLQLMTTLQDTEIVVL